MSRVPNLQVELSREGRQAHLDVRDVVAKRGLSLRVSMGSVRTLRAALDALESGTTEPLELLCHGEISSP